MAPVMLSIKRVPTIVSNFQKDDNEPHDKESGGGGCRRNCLSECCLQGAKLPLYTFDENSSSHGLGFMEGEKREKPAELSFLDTLLLGQWEERMQRGLFRYDVTACETKVIPGKWGFIAQLNEGRHLKKRPTEFRVDKVLQPFDSAKFNFTRIAQDELLFMFEATRPAAAISAAGFFDGASLVTVPPEPPRSVVAINVSPIEYGHVLLIPRVLECLPQRMDHESFLLALQMAAEVDNPYFRLGYNSLGAFATINHLHFQAYYLSMPFPVEKAPTRKIVTLESGVRILRLLDYPVRGFVFQSSAGGDRRRLRQYLSDAVADACVFLQDNNIPYNVLISDSGDRVFLFPQCYAEKQALGEVSKEVLETQVNPAVWEISGHMVLKRRQDYDEASEANAWRLLAEVSLSDERFREVEAYVLQAVLPAAAATATATAGGDEYYGCNVMFSTAVLEKEECNGGGGGDEEEGVGGGGLLLPHGSREQECVVLH